MCAGLPGCEGSQRAGRCSAGACGHSSLSSAVLVTHRLNLESDINTAAAAAQTLPGSAALTHGLGSSSPGEGLCSAGGCSAPSQRPVRRYIRKNRTGVNRSCLTAFIFRSLLFLLWYGPQKDCFATGKGSYQAETTTKKPRDYERLTGHSSSMA